MSHASEDHAVEIVICVHNSPDDVQRCLSSVIETLRCKDRLIIVDDGSEEETKNICEVAADRIGHEKCLLIRRPNGTGFCRAANAGLRATTAETVIMLNSDTVVTECWISKITACMTSNWQLGIVGPLSNAGGWQSIPRLPTQHIAANEMSNDPSHISKIQTLCSEFGVRFAPPIVEQINGFCMAVSREVLSTVGMFDEDNFPMGYGEENDLTFRALDAGFLCAIAVDCFVYHAKSKSYGSDSRVKYTKSGQERLFELHTRERVTSAVEQTRCHATMKAVRALSEEFDWTGSAVTK